ncbi:diguanylate cyclase domain-containing protein [Pseudactinotalea sp. Z1748]|uniref:diguanylate cyclase domain-containing protein n=1 Tax=Pseudactinotalea sp. Z1748 TaxID=3413027 RepID=UPI003C7A782A
MSWLDPATMSLATALVVVVSGIAFLTDTVVHARNRAARVWALSFMAGILAVMCYLAWEFLAGAWVAAAVGNAAFVVTTGCMWVGGRVYNDRAMAPGVALVGLLAVTTLLSTLTQGPGGGSWAGAEVMFLALLVLSGLGSIEARRGGLGTTATSWGLTAALGVQCLYYIARTWVFLTRGPESELFLEWFDTAPTSVITIALTISVVVSLSVLRAQDRARPARGTDITLSQVRDGFLGRGSFEGVLQGQLHRAEQRQERLAVIVLQTGGLDQIRSAFGTRAAEEVATRWREGIQTAVPLSAVVGQVDPATVVISAPVLGANQAKRLAGQISQRVLDEFNAAATTATVIVGVGVCVSVPGLSARDLLDRARTGAIRSAAGAETAIVLVEADEAAAQAAVSR